MQDYYTLINAQSYMKPEVPAAELRAWVSVFVSKAPQLLLEARDLAFLDLLLYKLPWLNFQTSHG
jgi:hypothetical protein